MTPQPISFVPEKPCKNCGLDYFRPVQYGDDFTMQIPNTCTPYLGEEIILNGDFTLPDETGIFPASWQQGNGNGGTQDWATVDVANLPGGSAPSCVGANSVSKILSQAVTLNPFQLYALTFRVKVQSGCSIVVVGFNSGDKDSTDFTIIGTIAGTGSAANQSIEFLNPGYTRIGFYFTGECEGANYLDDVSLKEYLYTQCFKFCIKDGEGNIIIDDISTFDNASVVYYPDNIDVRFTWEALWEDVPMPEGCYYFCLCEGEMIENLFLFGDNGTMESSIAGLSGSIPEYDEEDDAEAHSGYFSFHAYYDEFIDVRELLTTGIMTFKPNTEYKIQLWIYADTLSAVGVAFDFSGLPGVTIIENTGTTILGAAGWVKVECVFKTGSTTSGYLILTLSEFGIQAFNYWIDDITLYETSTFQPCAITPFVLKTEHECSLLLEWYGDNDSLGFIYTTGFKNFLRVIGELQPNGYPGEKEVFTDSQGMRKMLYAESVKSELLSLMPLPEYIHNALALMLCHDHLFIDGVEYVSPKGEYQPNTKKNSKLAPALVEVIQANQNKVNSYCS